MKNPKKFVSLILVAVFLFSLFVATGCSRHPNQEQIQKMEETRSAALAAEKKLAEVQKERQKLEQQVEAKKAELKKVQDEKAMVEEALKNWQSEEK